MRIAHLLLLSVLLISITAGCKRRNPSITPLPGRQASVGPVGGGPTAIDPTRLSPGIPIDPGAGISGRNIDTNPDGTVPPSDRPDGYVPNRDRFAAETVYYDYDRSNIGAEETSKVDAVAEHLRAEQSHRVEVEGHADERGTEEYNRSLGDRRALAVRELLISKGISPERISTVSFGENRPAEIGTDEAAYAKNRRAEFILLLPPGQIQ